jgi:hypothetical protein
MCVDDVPDPYGGPSEGYHACAALILGEVGTFVAPAPQPAWFLTAPPGPPCHDSHSAA